MITVLTGGTGGAKFVDGLPQMVRLEELTLMAAQGFAVSIAGVADFYHDFLDLLLVDSKDALAADGLRKTGMRVHCTPTIMRKIEDRVALAKSVLEAAMQPPSSQAALERA